MGEARVVLTLMNRDGELTKFFPKQDTSSTIQLANERFAPFHANAESQLDEHRQLALFYCSGLHLMLEPFCENVTIQPPYPNAATDSSDGRIVLPHSLPGESGHHYIHLRPDDVIHFATHNLQVRYSLQNGQQAAAEADMPPAIPEAADGVQVKSSDPHQDVQGDPASDSETEDEEGVDPDRTATPMNVTPATSRPSATNEIKETPNHAADEEEEAPFSTAMDKSDDANSDRIPQVNGKPSSEIELTGDPVSRPSKQRKDRTTRSEDAPSVSRVLSFSQGDLGATPAYPKYTYGKRSRRNTPDKRVDAANSDDQQDADNSADHQDAADQEEDTTADLPTSQAMYPQGRAHEAARRSMSGKRRLAPAASDEDGIAAKARKLSPTEDVKSDAEADGDVEAKDDVDAAAEDDESDDDGPSQIEAGPRVASGRLPRVARSEESDDDNIVAKPKRTTRRPKSSPEVVVRAQRSNKSASKTPAGTPRTPDSTATSSLPGKPPKILISGNVTGSYTSSSALAKFIRSQGSTIITSVPSRRTNFLCMVKDDTELTKTPKVMRSLALGKAVVTERWINESKSAGELLDPADFIHDEVADTTDVDRSVLFFGKVLYFTRAAVAKYGDANWKEMQSLASEAGASTVESGTGGKGGSMTGRNSIIYFGMNEDPDATSLITEHGRMVYHKDLVRDAVVRGELDLDDKKYKVTAGKVKKGGRR